MSTSATSNFCQTAQIPCFLWETGDFSFFRKPRQIIYISFTIRPTLWYTISILRKYQGLPQPLLCLLEVCPMHSLLILVLILDALIAVSSVLNLVNMMRVNLMVEERRAEALTVQLVRVQDKRWQGWAAVLLVWGVRLPGQGRHRRVHLHQPLQQPRGRAQSHHGGAHEGLRGAGALRYRGSPGPSSGAAVAYGRRLFSAAGSVYPPVRHFLWTFRRSADGLPADPQADRQHSAGKI